MMARYKPTWQLLAAGLGLLLGLMVLLLRTSNATSYLSDEPETCINCHVMVPYYAGWFHSRHRTVATCNDCHIPHENKIKGLVFKAMDGARHSAVFTLGLEPQTLRLTAAASEVIQSNCVRCHQHQIMQVDMGADPERRCWECHRETPHGLAQSLSSSPNVLRPALPAAGIR